MNMCYCGVLSCVSCLLVFSIIWMFAGCLPKALQVLVTEGLHVRQLKKTNSGAIVQNFKRTIKFIKEEQTTCVHNKQCNNDVNAVWLFETIS